MAPVPKDPIEEWRQTNNGFLPRDYFKKYINPSTNEEKKAAADYEVIKIPPAKANEPEQGYFFRNKKEDSIEDILIVDRPGSAEKPTIIAIKEKELRVNGEVIDRKRESKDRDLVLTVGGVSKHTVIDLRDAQPDEKRRIFITIDTAYGMPKILMPSSPENITITVESVAHASQVEALKKGQKPELAVLPIEIAPLDDKTTLELNKKVMSGVGGEHAFNILHVFMSQQEDKKRTLILIEPKVLESDKIVKGNPGFKVQLVSTRGGKHNDPVDLIEVKNGIGKGDGPKEGRFFNPPSSTLPDKEEDYLKKLHSQLTGAKDKLDKLEKAEPNPPAPKPKEPPAPPAKGRSL